MSIDDKEQPETFVGRWSRLKKEARIAPAVPEQASPMPVDPAEEPPQLPAIDDLTLESDFRGFFHPKVEEATRRAALRKLFSDPHFNVMDGLDVYIDDYSKSEPIPAAMLASLKQAQRILDWAQNKEERAEDEAEPQQALADDAPPLIAATETAPEGVVPARDIDAGAEDALQHTPPERSRPPE